MAQYTIKRLSHWTVMKDGQVYSGPYFSRREAAQAAKRAAEQKPMSPEHAAAYHGDIDGDADPWIG